MAIDFPASPSVGQEYVYSDRFYTFTDQGIWSEANPLQMLPAGTLMMFQQTSAPTGWTKETSHHDKTLRLVSGTAAAGGTIAFSTVFGRAAVDDYTLTAATIPSHAIHSISPAASGTYFSGYLVEAVVVYGVPATLVNATAAAGDAGPHAHGLNLQVAHVDCIIASKT